MNRVRPTSAADSAAAAVRHAAFWAATLAQIRRDPPVRQVGLSAAKPQPQNRASQDERHAGKSTVTAGVTRPSRTGFPTVDERVRVRPVEVTPQRVGSWDDVRAQFGMVRCVEPVAG